MARLWCSWRAMLLAGEGVAAMLPTHLLLAGPHARLLALLRQERSGCCCKGRSQRDARLHIDGPPRIKEAAGVAAGLRCACHG